MSALVKASKPASTDELVQRVLTISLVALAISLVVAGVAIL